MNNRLAHSNPRSGTTSDQQQPAHTAKYVPPAGETNYQHLVDNQTDLVVKLDRDGRFQFVSPSYCEKFSSSEAELRGTMFNQQVHNRDLDRVNVAWQSLFTEPWTSQFEHRALTGKGHRWLGWALKALRDDNENVFEIVGVGRDVTERHNDEEQARVNLNALAHAGRIQSMGEMATGLAHELNQPLTAILSFSQASQRVLNEQDMDRDELNFALERIAVNAKLAGEIIGQVRNFVRKDESSPKKSSINQLVSDAMDLVNPELLQLEMDVELSLAEGIPNAMVDPVQIQQVILNLVRNSMEAIDSDAGNVRSITIGTLIDRPGRIRVTVTDSGPGMAPDIAEKVFDAFMSTKSDGMGIGLSICQSIVEAHGGEIFAKPNPGRGTTFSFVLPSIDE